MTDDAAASATALAALTATPTYADLLRGSPGTHKIFFGVVLVQVLCITLERAWLLSLTNLRTESALREGVWFLVVTLVSECFVLYFAIHGALQTSAPEMVAFFFASLVILSRLVIEFANGSEECSAVNARELCLAFIVLACTFLGSAMIFSIRMYRDLAWKRYKALGAAVNTRRMYRLFEAFSALRKLDVQFSLIALVTGIAFFVNAPSAGPHATELAWVSVALFVIELAWERLGDEGVKKESAKHLYAFWALSAFLPAFIIAVAVETALDGRLLILAIDASVRYSIVIMATFAVMNRALTVASTIALYRNFGPSYVMLRRIIEVDRKAAFARKRMTTGAGWRWGGYHLVLRQSQTGLSRHREGG